MNSAELKAEMLRTAVKIIEKGYTVSERVLSLNPDDIAYVYSELEKWLPV